MHVAFYWLFVELSVMIIKVYLTLPYLVLPSIYTPKSLKHFIEFRTASKGIIIVSMISNIKARESTIFWNKVFKMDQVKFVEDSL